MAIPLIEEPKNMVSERGTYERCFFCDTPTKWWHHKTNNPICTSCSKKHKVAELTNYTNPKTKNKI